MSLEESIQTLEERLRSLDEIIARKRHELIWRKREVRPGYEPIGIVELEQEYLDLSNKFTETWREWNELNRQLDD